VAFIKISTAHLAEQTLPLVIVKILQQQQVFSHKQVRISYRLNHMSQKKRNNKREKEEKRMTIKIQIKKGEKTTKH
jgi:hypothetical protein